MTSLPLCAALGLAVTVTWDVTSSLEAGCAKTRGPETIWGRGEYVGGFIINKNVCFFLLCTYRFCCKDVDTLWENPQHLGFAADFIYPFDMLWI